MPKKYNFAKGRVLRRNYKYFYDINAIIFHFIEGNFPLFLLLHAQCHCYFDIASIQLFNRFMAANKNNFDKNWRARVRYIRDGKNNILVGPKIRLVISWIVVVLLLITIRVSRCVSSLTVCSSYAIDTRQPTSYGFFISGIKYSRHWTFFLR